MSSNFSDRGMRELEYRVIPTGSALQRDIQLAGHVSTCTKLEEQIRTMEKPNDATPRNDTYNHLARKLNRHAENPNAGGAGAWEKTKKEVLTYFDSRLPVYADPKDGRIPSNGYILDTIERKLYYFDGSRTRQICSFMSDTRSWLQVQNMFPTLFNPPMSVVMGMAANYTILQPETSINLMYLARRLNPNAQFDKFVDTAFLPLFTNLAQHAATRALLVKHEDTRTLEQLTADIVREMLGTVSGYISKLISEGKGRRSLSDERQELLFNIIQYLNTGDYSLLADSVAKYDSAWVTKTANWFFNNEIDKTLNIIKEMRQSAFLDTALQTMVTQQYGADRGLVAMEHWRQKIFGRVHERAGDEEVLQRRLAEHYGAGKNLEEVLQEKMDEQGEITHIKDMEGDLQRQLLADHGVINLAEAAENRVLYEHNVTTLADMGAQRQQEAAILKARAEILDEVQSRITQKLTSQLLEQIADELPGIQIEDVHATTEDDEGAYEFESHIVDFESSAEEVDALWETCRVTKEAFSASLTDMSEKIAELATKNEAVELPAIPLAQELVLEDGGQEEKTIIVHIQDSIARLQEKVAADKSKAKKSYYQADCASLQNSINKILAYQFVGESAFMLTEEQRAVYNEVGSELTTILNATDKKPAKDLEVMSSVTPVRDEIHRLIAFHNGIREQLAQFQQKLRSIDQGTFFNDIQKFVIKGAALDKKQMELQGLLDGLTGCQDVQFNVLAPENEWQRKVCDTVRALTESGTELVDELQDLLLHQQTPLASEGEAPKPREYKKVTPKKDSDYAARFEPIMEGIKEFAETLHHKEASRLATYFDTRSTRGLGMFDHDRDDTRSGHGEELGRRRGFSLGSEEGDV